MDVTVKMIDRNGPSKALYLADTRSKANANGKSVTQTLKRFYGIR